MRSVVKILIQHKVKYSTTLPSLVPRPFPKHPHAISNCNLNGHTATATGSERTDFLHEIDTMKKVAESNNPHVITFIGCVTVQKPLYLIMEFVKYGDLLSYLETIRKMVGKIT